jgi:hypothetical protein
MNGKAEKKKENSSSIPSSSSSKDMVLLGSEKSSNRSSVSRPGHVPVCGVQETDAKKHAQNPRSRSHSPCRKATYRFLRLGTLPRAAVQLSAATPLPSLSQTKNKEGSR